MDTHAKLNLSAAAIKAAAKTLKSLKDADARGAAAEAVRAGLRQDAPEPFVLFGPDDAEVTLSNPVAWVVGASGCGKSEAAFAWLRFAAFCGHRTLFVGPEQTFLSRWHPQDLTVIDAVRDGDWQATLIRGFTSAATPHLALRIPFIQHDHADNVLRTAVALVSAAAYAPKGMWIVLDEVDWRAHAVTWPAVAEARPDLRFVCLAQHSSHIAALIRPQDARVRMWSASAQDAEERSLQNQGEALVDLPGGTRVLDTPYLWEDTPSRAVSDAAVAAIDRLSAALTAHAPGTHTERLETVARACGFRSWHAAEGRR